MATHSGLHDIRKSRTTLTVQSHHHLHIPPATKLKHAPQWRLKSQSNSPLPLPQKPTDLPPRVSKVSSVLPITNPVKIAEAKPSQVNGEEDAYRRLRIARSDARLVGVREKRAKIKAEQAEAQKK